ncbi:hypothetical protein cypCar_00014475 [Cyprinus carpio]|nr:hypothetical protein cypCar_00014475 [Cyprinus carpio]
MVAGMVMPLDNLKAIYEHLFRDGVMVAKKDKRPQTKHPEIPSVDNLHVIRAMGSLKSRGYVRETFAWRHYYWYLTNEGIVYLRDYLHLPPEIVPTPLQRVRRPAATLAITRRAEHVQAVHGPTSYVPKPGKMGAERQEALLDRQEYRRKMVSMDEAEMMESRERTPRFRGRPMASTQIKPKGSWESKEQPMLSDTPDYTKEMEPSVRRKVAVHSVCLQKTQTVNVSPDVATISSKVGAIAAESTSTATGENKMVKDAHLPTPSKPKVEKKQKAFVAKNVQDVPAVSSVERTIAVESSLYSVHTKAVKKKPKEEVVFQQTSSTVTAKDAPRPTPSKPEVEETQQAPATKNVQDVSSTSGATSGKSSVSSAPAEAAKEKPKEEVFFKVSKKTTSTVADNSKMAESALHPSELKVEKTQQSLMSKNVQDVPAVSSAVESSVSTEAVKEKPKQEVYIKVSQTTSTGDSKRDKDAPHPTPPKPKVEKTQKTRNVQGMPAVSSAAETGAVKSFISTKAGKEKPKEEMHWNPLYCLSLLKQ